MLEPPLVDIEVSCTDGAMSLTLTAKARSGKLRSAYVALVTQCAATLNVSNTSNVSNTRKRPDTMHRSGGISASGHRDHGLDVIPAPGHKDHSLTYSEHVSELNMSNHRCAACQNRGVRTVTLSCLNSCLMLAVSSAVSTPDGKYHGGAVVGHNIIFAPYHTTTVGIFNMNTSKLDESTTTELSTDALFQAAVHVNNQVVFAPSSADVVGVLDVNSRTFYSVSMGYLTGHYKFQGAAAVGSKVVFAPFDSPVVGIFDASTFTFGTTVITSELVGTTMRFDGAAAVGDKVVFAPHASNVVGVFDVFLNTFDASVSVISATISARNLRKFSGAATMGNKVVFAPLTVPFVGVFDGDTGNFEEVTNLPMASPNFYFASGKLEVSGGKKVEFETPIRAYSEGPHEERHVGVAGSTQLNLLSGRPASGASRGRGTSSFTCGGWWCPQLLFYLHWPTR
eukprot:4987816-Prymnesium_polylepis.1